MEFSNRFSADPLSLDGIMAAKRELTQTVRYFRRKAARVGTRGRRGALSSAEVERRYRVRCEEVVNSYFGVLAA